MNVDPTGRPQSRSTAVAVAEYHDELRGAGKSDKTIADYVKYVRRLGRYADERGYCLDDIPTHVVRDWADREVRNSWASRKQARTALAHLWRRRRDDEPWHAIRTPRKPRPTYRGLPPEDAAKLRNAALMVGGREGLATLLCMYTGARAGEVAAMRWDGVAEGTIRWWRTKTSEWHMVPLHPTLRQVIEDMRDGDGPMFTGNNGRAYVSTVTIWAWVGKVGEIAGVKVAPHQLRATAGTMVLEATGDLDAACEFLGHRDPAVTRNHYTRTSQRRLDEAIQALEYQFPTDAGGQP